MSAEDPPRVAVVGMSGRFPGAGDLDSFWADLRDGVEATTTFSDDELEAVGISSRVLRDPACVRAAPVLAAIDLFDAGFFGLTVREAERIDPQQRLLLECAWEALEQAGWTRARSSGRVGVYVGSGTSNYLEPRMEGVNVVTELENLLGNDKDYAATRLSYKLDLRGPSVTVQTACSTSLVAIHMACQALLAGECDLALAGGARVRIPQKMAFIYQEGGLLSPDGRCRAFDAAANGTTFGSGAGVVALKRLEDALADGDCIQAVILGSAVNNDGASKVGFVAPSVEGQAEVIGEALAVAGVDPATISYVEAHGTGTPLGDPIEVAALARAFRQRAQGPIDCALGSVKTNVGHLETAAGVAGFIKTVLALRHRLIPPSLNFVQPNPQIDFAAGPFRVAAALEPMRPRGDRLRAGVSSFGIGGTNAHVVLEEAPGVGERERLRKRRVQVLPVSGRSERSLRAQAERVAGEVERAGGEVERGREWLEDAAYTLGARRTHHGERVCVVGESAGELAAGLRGYGRGEGGPGVASGQWAGGRRRVVFVYSGQGSQWVGMGRRLAEEEEEFRRRLSECDAAVRAAGGPAVLEVLRSGEEDERWKRVEVIQPLLFAMQLSLTAQWQAWGVEPDAVVGHSLGEVAASVVAGGLGLEDGARVIVRRSRLVSQTCGRGGMALVELSAEHAERELRAYPGVSIASYHGPETVLVSGERESVQRLVRAMEGRGVFARQVEVDYASHSAQVDGVLPELRQQLRGLAPRRGRLLQFSTLLGEPISGEELDGEYWVRNLREPVRFHQAVERLVDSGHELFVEVSPHPVLTPTIQRTLQTLQTGQTGQTRGTRGEAQGSLRRGADEVRELSEGLARLYASGAAVDWERRHAGSGARPVRLPAYAWTRERHWLEPSRPSAGADLRPARAADHGWLSTTFLSASEPGTRLWQGELDPQEPSQSHLQEHLVRGVPVVAGALWLEAALHVARKAGGPAAEDRCLEEVAFTDLLLVELGQRTTAQLVATAGGFEILSAPASEGDSWTRHAHGRFAPAPAAEAAEELGGLRARCRSEREGPAFYEAARARGVEYRGRYAGLSRLWLGDGEAVAELTAIQPEPTRWQIEPWSLDACLQVLGATLGSDGEGTYLPVGVGRLVLRGRPGQQGWVHARSRRISADAIEGEVRLFDSEGRPLVEATGVTLRRAGRRRDEHEDWLHGIEWKAQPAPADAPAASGGSWLVIGGGTLASRVGEELEARGQRCRRLAGEEPLAGAALEAALSHAECRAVLYLPDTESGGPGGDFTAEASVASSVNVLRIVQGLARLGRRDGPRLWLATRGTQAVEPHGPPVSPRHATLWGLGRTLVHEHPELRPACVDLPAEPDGVDLAALVAELLADGPEDHVAWRGHQRFVARFLRASARPTTPDPLQPAGDRPFGLFLPHPGILDHLALREIARPAPGPGEVELEVAATGLNLLDVLLALGALPDDAPSAAAGTGPRLGGECAGTVSRVGPGVEGLRPGDRVVAIAAEAFRSFVVAPAGFVVPLPAGVELEAGAGIPIAFLTAHFALREVARLSAGERVLIHAASTGVGAAAVQIARAIGAEVFATAGSEDKRERLRALGVRQVMDSRSLDFARGVREATGGEGVDVVLNSLSGEYIPTSLGLLRAHGRFVEIGKRDYYDDRKLGLRPFLRGLSFSLLDLRGMLVSRPRAVAEALRRVAAEIEAGSLSALPVEPFPIVSAAAAFNHLAQAKHRGKVVIAMRDREAPIARRHEPARVRPDGTYLITGGLGGLGLKVAEQLAQQGAGRLVLMGRGAPSAQAEQVVAALRAGGTTVLTASGDVAVGADVERVVRTVAAADPGAPLRGVVHAAGVLDDGFLVRQTVERFTAVMAPKVAGAWNLHLATRHERLDFFVLFSSIAGLLGAPGQASYAAGNTFLDALAHHRRALGLPALSIDWGAWAEVGLAAAQDNRGKRAAGQGLESLSPARGLAAFASLLASPLTQVAVAPLDPRRWFQANPLAAQWRLLSDLVPDSAAPRGPRSTAFTEKLKAARPHDRRGMLLDHLAAQVAAVLRTSAERIEPRTTLASLGLDSLTALELRNRLEVSLGLALRATLIWAHPTTAGLAEFVARELGLELGGGAGPAADPGPAPAAAAQATALEIEQMSDAEAEAALLDTLAGIEGVS